MRQRLTIIFSGFLFISLLFFGYHLYEKTKPKRDDYIGEWFHEIPVDTSKYSYTNLPGNRVEITERPRPYILQPTNTATTTTGTFTLKDQEQAYATFYVSEHEEEANKVVGDLLFGHQQVMCQGHLYHSIKELSGGQIDVVVANILLERKYSFKKLNKKPKSKAYYPVDNSDAGKYDSTSTPEWHPPRQTNHSDTIPCLLQVSDTAMKYEVFDFFQSDSIQPAHSLAIIGKFSHDTTSRWRSKEVWWDFGYEVVEDNPTYETEYRGMNLIYADSCVHHYTHISYLDERKALLKTIVWQKIKLEK